FVIEGNEESKSMETLLRLVIFMKEKNVDKKGALVAVGGGVIGDIATVAAGLYFRGIDCIQIPTTLLAQVDSAIGGKGAVNIGTHKNTIGIIRQPRLVIIDTEFLASLPKEQFTSGMAEVVKYAIAFDNELFEKLQTTKDLLSELPWIINRCSTIKMGIVKKDPLEQNIRALVNFGHTAGQAIELLAKIPHGYAIAVGMTFAIKVSTRMHLLHKSMADAALELIKQYKLPTTVQGLSIDDIYKQIRKDKKTVSNVPKFVLLTKIGEAKPNQMVPEKIILDVLQEILV
ncbi:3-dehydroquinate synthase, partial [Candidatus Microgenomates bacterium]|nr:3-dehydroquinate synthase [Candidatus Microgenomates bacterium]